ncbi:MAG: hypothetical protein K0Q51_536 [Rickettsiaceae bacterium]|nr:hypothetical protein [Rickettsiaceae bacterium]
MDKTSLKEREVTEESVTSLKTRFGYIDVHPGKVIHFPLGLLGIPQEKRYYLAAYPDKDVHSYSLLQSVEFADLCFLTVPLASEFYSAEDSLISKSDVQYAREHYNIKELAVLLVATIHNNKKKKVSKVSVNLKAPILIDTEKFVAYQHVFMRKEYSLKYYVN